MRLRRYRNFRESLERDNRICSAVYGEKYDENRPEAVLKAGSASR